MSTDLPIRCTCGALRGTARGVSGDTGNRVVCYCDDCQAFAHFLGRADEILDRCGGTDIFQLSQACVELTQGTGRLACIRLTPKGLLRWYADCCSTPIGNMLPTRQVPLVGLVHSCIDARADGGSLDAALGPVRGRVWGRFANGRPQERGLHDRAPMPMMLRIARLCLTWRLRGDHRRSAFFDAATAQPVVTPQVLSDEQYRRVTSARDPTGGLAGGEHR